LEGKGGALKVDRAEWKVGTGGVECEKDRWAMFLGEWAEDKEVVRRVTMVLAAWAVSTMHQSICRR
jgi:hypothetical protein